jgi:hypothetical protein
MEKKLPQALAALLTPQDVRGRRVRLMFQDDARFGRMVRIRRCWARLPARPMVSNGYEREFVYVYGAVSPLEGQLDWMISRQMNTVNMSEFLAQVSAKHRRDFIVMVVDGASSHVCKDLVIPEEHPPAAASALCARAQSPGTRVGRTARKGVPEPRIC